jgi:hypothetical protein
MKTKIILLMLLLVLIVGFLYFFNKENNFSTQLENRVAQEFTMNEIKESTNVADLKDKNVFVYTSYKLGVQLSYLKDSGFGSLQTFPVESGDRISLDNSNYVRVFRQLPNESVAETLKRVVPENFVNANCRVVNLNSNEYAIFDSRIPIDYFPVENTLDGTPYQDLENVCASPILPFITDPAFPGVVYFIARETQAVSYWADTEHTKFWFQTVHLIAK